MAKLYMRDLQPLVTARRRPNRAGEGEQSRLMAIIENETFIAVVVVVLLGLAAMWVMTLAAPGTMMNVTWS